MSAVHATTPHLTGQLGERAELAHECLYYMTMMRETEDRIERKLYRQGKILGGVYVGHGQEALPVGTALLATPDDVLLPSHRDMAVFMIRGIPARRIFAQYMGRVDGLTRGREGNMHMGDLKLGRVSIISALAATVPVAAGMAIGLRYQGKNGVAFSYFGDGATSRCGPRVNINVTLWNSEGRAAVRIYGLDPSPRDGPRILRPQIGWFRRHVPFVASVR